MNSTEDFHILFSNSNKVFTSEDIEKHYDRYIEHFNKKKKSSLKKIRGFNVMIIFLPINPEERNYVMINDNYGLYSPLNIHFKLDYPISFECIGVDGGKKRISKFGDTTNRIKFAFIGMTGRQIYILHVEKFIGVKKTNIIPIPNDIGEMEDFEKIIDPNERYGNCTLQFSHSTCQNLFAMFGNVVLIIRDDGIIPSYIQHRVEHPCAYISSIVTQNGADENIFEFTMIYDGGWESNYYKIKKDKVKFLFEKEFEVDDIVDQNSRGDLINFEDGYLCISRFKNLKKTYRSYRLSDLILNHFRSKQKSKDPNNDGEWEDDDDDEYNTYFHSVKGRLLVNGKDMVISLFVESEYDFDEEESSFHFYFDLESEMYSIVFESEMPDDDETLLSPKEEDLLKSCILESKSFCVLNSNKRTINLPNEILLEIFMFLKYDEIIRKIEILNKSFRNNKLLWTLLYKRDFILIKDREMNLKVEYIKRKKKDCPFDFYKNNLTWEKNLII